MQGYQVLKYSLGKYSSKQTGSSLYCPEVSQVHWWSHAVTGGMWNNNMTALVNTFTRFTCQEDSGRAALKGRDDSSFPCFVLFAENRTIWGACSWRERERECLLSCDLIIKRILMHDLFDVQFRPADSISCFMVALWLHTSTVLPDKYIEGLQLLQTGETRTKAVLSDINHGPGMKPSSHSPFELSTSLTRISRWFF